MDLERCFIGGLQVTAQVHSVILVRVWKCLLKAEGCNVVQVEVWCQDHKTTYYFPFFKLALHPFFLKFFSFSLFYFF